MCPTILSAPHRVYVVICYHDIHMFNAIGNKGHGEPKIGLNGAKNHEIQWETTFWGWKTLKSNWKHHKNDFKKKIFFSFFFIFSKILLSPPPPSSLLAPKGQRTLRPSDACNPKIPKKFFWGNHQKESINQSISKGIQNIINMHVTTYTLFWHTQVHLIKVAEHMKYD